jgi:hypothetical protein
MPGKTNPRYLATDGFKLCNVCETVKVVSEFYARKDAPDGYRNDCTECVLARSQSWYQGNQEYATAQAREYSRNNREKINARNRTDKHRASMRQYRAKNSARINEQMRALRASDRERFRRYDRKRRLIKLGATLEEYEALLEAQGGVCAICQGPPNGKDPDIYHIDHDHETGVLRGLLCHSCNTSLGHFRDDVATLRRAIEYLSDPPFRHITEGTLF